MRATKEVSSRSSPFTLLIFYSVLNVRGKDIKINGQIWTIFKFPLKICAEIGEVVGISNLLQNGSLYLRYTKTRQFLQGKLIQVNMQNIL